MPAESSNQTPLSELTGLESVQRFMDGEVEQESMSETIPMRPTHVEAGKVIFDIEADERHQNLFGGVHGGFAATVIDSTTGCAVQSMLGRGEGFATIDLNIKMLRPIPKHTVLKAEGRILNVSKTIALAEGNIKDDQGKLYAHGSAVCKVLRA